ncbi:MAG: hypothetical protein EAZ25_16990 [Oscillatoriales cyanobacterium]|nr:MAG: hypothetical protein EAZ25_16990 [Oscillatoriales cyanobacterium]
MPPKSIWQHSINLLYPQLLTSEFHRWYPPRDLSVESIPNRKSKILSSPEFIRGVQTQRASGSSQIRVEASPRAIATILLARPIKVFPLDTIQIFLKKLNLLRSLSKQVS